MILRNAELFSAQAGGWSADFSRLLHRWTRLAQCHSRSRLKAALHFVAVTHGLVG
jgi:hypothetical protein